LRPTLASRYFQAIGEQANSHLTGHATRLKDKRQSRHQFATRFASIICRDNPKGHSFTCPPQGRGPRAVLPALRYGAWSRHSENRTPKDGRIAHAETNHPQFQRADLRPADSSAHHPSHTPLTFTERAFGRLRRGPAGRQDNCPALGGAGHRGHPGAQFATNLIFRARKTGQIGHDKALSRIS
jgi:hypothetical protein